MVLKVLKHDSASAHRLDVILILVHLLHDISHLCYLAFQLIFSRRSDLIVNIEGRVGSAIRSDSRIASRDARVTGDWRRRSDSRIASTDARVPGDWRRRKMTFRERDVGLRFVML